MIYIFKGFQGICSLPGYLCSGCGQACKSCPGACKFVSQYCMNCGAECKHFMERPLSAYVIISFLLSGFTLYKCFGDLGTPEGCSSNFLYILMAFSVLNIIFAIYVQCMVWKEIMTDEHREKFIDGDKPEETYTGQMGSAAVGMFAKAKVGLDKQGIEAPAVAVPHAGEKVATDPGRIIVPKEVVQASFKKVFQEDFGVLIMFFLLLGMFFLSWKGQDLVDTTEPKCDVGDITAECGFLFFWLAFLWTFMYACCACCSNKVSIAKPKEDEQLEGGYDAVAQQ